MKNRPQLGIFRKKTTRWLGYLAPLTLLIAWWVGYQHSATFTEQLQAHFPSAQITPVTRLEHGFDIKIGKEHSRIYAAQAQGYGGPLSVVFSVDSQDRIRNLQLVDHVDTPGYVVNVLNQRFLERLEGKKITERFSFDSDVDSISGATLTSSGITHAVRLAAHELATSQGFQVENASITWAWEVSDLLVVLLILLVLFERRLPRGVHQYHLLIVGGLSVLVIGYWANMALSLSSVSSFLLGYWPDPRLNLAIYLILTTVVIGVVLMGKNLYCNSLCPFHHIQRWAHKISGNNWPIPELVKRNAVDIINVLLWVSLVLIFLSRNPAISGYEPFSMLFSLDGVGVQWYILPLALFGSFFVKDFWCRLFCPLGRGINYSVAKRQSIRKTLSQWIHRRS
ncbi:putative membrane bound regulatory protein [Vibrio sp. RC586]|uniref:FMN-binding protein n=1 Tax=Vibrio sp. RC586 TaxID=675815 RepID=UPI0001BB84F2|nr:FMN-binding protein [Vibrio sp. RC586]EEZ01309.1 putative membrane bound regulatory protein [Vibrio sp. RC586]